MQIQPYLFFEGRCEEAIEFYKNAVGARVNLVMRYKDCPEPPASGFGAEMLEKVMHGSLLIGDSTVLVSDGHAKGKANFAGFSLSLLVADDAEAQRRFDALADGGKVGMPLGRTFFSSKFGVVTDRFGVMWMVFARG